MSNKNIVVAGGAGYIGSHVCVELLEAGYTLLVIDDFSNSHPKSLDRVRQITGINDAERLQLLTADMADHSRHDEIVEAVAGFNASGAIHLAGLKAVGESVAEPGRYYHTNINATLTLLDALKAANAKRLVFSSSATVYGDLNKSPVDESGKTGPTNPYGHTKHMIEQMLSDVARSDEAWKVCNLRYFNPVGAHDTGLIGEDPNDIPNNLFPYIAQVAVGRREKLSVYGDDYATPDGTGVRDYIHVCDLANGHLKALEYLNNDKVSGASHFNLGTGIGYSVLDVVKAFGAAAGKALPYQIVARRDGDIAEIYANSALAEKELGWRAEKNLEDMCADHWRWQSQNPNGFGD